MSPLYSTPQRPYLHRPYVESPQEIVARLHAELAALGRMPEENEADGETEEGP